MPRRQTARLFAAALAVPFSGRIAAAADSITDPIIGYDGLFRSEASELTGVQLVPDARLSGASAWLSGDFMLAGTHGFEMGPTKFGHAFDAFGRVLRFRLRPGGQRAECTFSARMIPSQYYLKAKAAGHIMPGLHFEDTVPSLNASLPRRMAGPSDNVYVQQTHFGGQYWSTTDGTTALTYNDDLEGWGQVKWQDDLRLSQQVTHIVVAPGTGKIVGLGSKARGMTLFEIDPASPHTRVELVSFDVPKVPYEHSFGLGNDLAIVCAHPFAMNPMKILTKNLLDSMELDETGNTTLYLVDLKTKNVQGFVAPPFVIYHFGNVHEDTNGDVIFESPVMQHCNAYSLFDMPTALSSEALNHFRDNCTNVLRRFTLHRSGPLAGTVTSTVLDAGWIEFPQFNQLWRGRAACYLYFIEWYHGGPDAEYASMALVKFDLCSGRRAAEWAVRGHFPGEPKFVPRPGATEEDDGVLITPVLDGDAQSSYLLVLDAATMQPVERFAIGQRVPSTLHGAWEFAGHGA